MTDNSDLIERLRAACVGHPSASIAWPHRILHEAADALSSQSLSLSEAREEIERLRALNAANGEFRKSTKELVAVSQPLIAQLDERLGLATGELDTLRKAYIEAREAEKAAERQRDDALDAAKTMDEAQAAWFSRAWVAEEALKQFVAHYPMGVNPFLDDAFRCARSVLENGPAGLADANPNPASPDLSSLRKGAEVRRDDPFRPAVDVDADDDYYPSREDD